VQADIQAGVAAGVTGTPAFFVNGRFLNGAQPLQAFVDAIEYELQRARGGGGKPTPEP
jgi:protein-disulfide isomerase